jgi:hypothetical protein
MAANRATYGAVAVLALGILLTGCRGGTGSAASTPSGTATVQKSATPAAGTPRRAGVDCTNQIDYAGDPRSNAEINSIGERTGYCPSVQH